MAIHKNADGDGHFIRITATKDRSNRKPYQRKVLDRPRAGFWASLLAIFGRFPSVLDSSNLTANFDRETMLSKRVRFAERKGLALADAKTLIAKVQAYLHECFVTIFDTADTSLDQLKVYLDEEKQWLEETRPAEIKAQLIAKLDSIIREIPIRMSSCAEAVLKKSIALTIFHEQYERSERDNWGKPLDLEMFGQLGVLVIVEFVANAVFQSSTQESALLGGAVLALFTSLVTIILGFLFGCGVQFSKTLAWGKGWVGFALAVLGGLLGFLFLSELALERSAADAGLMDATKFASDALMQNPLAGLAAMLDLPTFSYTICLIALIAAVARKYVVYYGNFPGHRKKMLEYIAVRDERDHLYQIEVLAAQTVIAEQMAKLEAAPAFIRDCKAPIERLVADFDNVVQQYENEAGEIERAGEVFDRFMADHSALEPPEILKSMDAVCDKLKNLNWQEVTQRQSQFSSNATELLDWEEVSQATIDKTNVEIDKIARDKLTELAKQREQVDEDALDSFRKSREWDFKAVALATKKPELITSV